MTSAIALVGHLWVVWWTWSQTLAGTMHVAFTGDVRARYGFIAALARPWVDQSVEFPPLSVLLMRPLAFGTQDHGWLGIHLLIQTSIHIATAVVVWRGWGLPGVRRYLIWTLPMAPVLLLRVDLLSMLCVAVALLLLQRGRDDEAGVAIAAGVFAKVWPGVLILTLAQRRWRAASTAAVVTAVGTLTWMALTTAQAPAQVLGFRGATGWHNESVVGSIVRLVDGGEPEIQSGAWRFGHASWPLTVLLGLAALALVVWACGREEDPGRQLLVGVSVFLVVAPLLSVQYGAWLAMAFVLADATWGERVAGMVAVVGSHYVLWWIGDVIRAEGDGWRVLLLRNAALVVLAVMVLVRARRGPSRPPARGTRGAPGSAQPQPAPTA